MVASLFLDDTCIYYGNRTKVIRKTKCHPETPNQLLPDFPQEMALVVGCGNPPPSFGR